MYAWEVLHPTRKRPLAVVWIIVLELQRLQWRKVHIHPSPRVPPLFGESVYSCRLFCRVTMCLLSLRRRTWISCQSSNSSLLKVDGEGEKGLCMERLPSNMQILPVFVDVMPAFDQTQYLIKISRLRFYRRAQIPASQDPSFIYFVGVNKCFIYTMTLECCHRMVITCTRPLKSGGRSQNLIISFCCIFRLHYTPLLCW